MPLSGGECKAVTVLMYSEHVKSEDIITLLSFHCSVIRGEELKDEDTIRAGAYRFYVNLRRNELSGELIHLPPTIQLGAIRGHVFYPGQPNTCRKCCCKDHLANKCLNVFCRNCKGNCHFSKECQCPTSCNLCGKVDHTFRTCPNSYANRTKLNLQKREEERLAAVETLALAAENLIVNQANDTQLQYISREEGEDPAGEPRRRNLKQTWRRSRYDNRRNGYNWTELNMAGNADGTGIQETHLMSITLERAKDLGVQSSMPVVTSKECRDLLDMVRLDIMLEPEKVNGSFDEMITPSAPRMTKTVYPLLLAMHQRHGKDSQTHQLSLRQEQGTWKVGACLLPIKRSF